MNTDESQPQEIGLFPLNLVLVPGEQAPLHIFEPRYRELIGECLDSGDEFGLVLEDDDGMRGVGVRCAVVEVIDRFPDGRLNVVVEAHDRFQLVGLTEGRTFHTGEIEAVPDETDTPSDDEVEECLAAYARVVAAAEADLDELDLDADSIAYQIASRVDFGTVIKQGLLELRSERERVLRLAPMLNQAAEAVERETEIRHRAGSNGRVEPL
jgi:Lon protease-like protein